MIRSRLDMQISEGLLSTEAAAALYAASPFHHQNDSRSNKFWMTSHPHAVDDSGVTLLLEHWGGEGVYFWLKDADLNQVGERHRETSRYRDCRSSQCDKSCLWSCRRCGGGLRTNARLQGR